MDKILEQYGLKREDLKAEELEVLDRWAQQVNQNSLSVVDIEGYIDNMIGILEDELFGYKNPESFVELLFRKKRNIHLEARLRNYMLLKNVMTAPQKAQLRIQKQLEHLKKPPMQVT